MGKTATSYRIESLLSARLHVAPQIVGDRVYFISDVNGKLSLYGMAADGSVPELLTPPDIALPNPHHLEGAIAYRVLPALGKILLMLDYNGDENYQPCFLPIEGGFPEPLFGERFAGQQVVCTHLDEETLNALLLVDPRREPIYDSYRVNLKTLEIAPMRSSAYGNFPLAPNADYTEVAFADAYTSGDVVLFKWDEERGSTLLYGKPIEQRSEGEEVALTGFGAAIRTEGNALLLTTSIFEDTYSLGYLPLDGSGEIKPVTLQGIVHSGVGELIGIVEEIGNNALLHFNIDGASWLYEGVLDEDVLVFTVQRVLCGESELAGGVLESVFREKSSGRIVLSFSTATSPAQLYRIEPDGAVTRLTNERILGVPQSALSPGEEASYTSHDGLRISARLYMPAAELGYTGARPVIFYIHGGPQSQERPDFTWFSMPLIQFFTLNGFAVWVPNVRGSSGYGLAYQKQVDRDWGGKDRLDHVAAYELLKADPRLDMTRVGVMGRSYGGYMTLSLIGRHPELWGAAVDMFGPYNLFTFIERMPPTWRTYFHLAVGHPEKDEAQLREMSPSTYLSNLACPLLILQGGNDPRVVEQESRDVAERLQAENKDVEYMVFADEGHDVIRYANKVACYNKIVDFFRDKLGEKATA